MILTIETLILILIVIGSACYAWRGNPQTKDAIQQLLTKPDKLILSLLSVSYAIFSLIHLGAFSQFKTTWSGDKTGKQLTLQLATPTKISAIYYYSGINSGKYHWNYRDQNAEEQPINDPTANLGYPAHFKWNKIELVHQFIKFNKLI